MAPHPEYAIPPESSEGVRERLYLQYRNKLDEESFRRARARIIDVAPESVGVENADSEAATDGNPAKRAARSDFDPAGSPRSFRPSSAGGDSSRAARPNLASENGLSASLYRPDIVSGQIELQTTPYPRGLFVDLMV